MSFNMKTILVYFASFLALCSVSLYQSCEQSDHVTCRTFTGITLSAFDITATEYKLLKEGDEVFAKKFAFVFATKMEDVLCQRQSANIMNSAFAYYNNSDNIFIKDTIKEIEIYCAQNFNSTYPAGSILNNLFIIPTLNSNAIIYNWHNAAQMITLDEVPAQTDFYKFYVKIKTKENKVLVDSLPTIKIKI